VATVFKAHPNNVSVPLGAAYTAGSGSLVLQNGGGVRFGTTFPLVATVATAASYGQPGEINSIFLVTGRTGDTLTGVSATEGSTDRNFDVGDRCDCRWTDGMARSIEGAVNGVENSAGITAGVIAPARLGTGTPSAPTAYWLRADGIWSPYLSQVNRSGSGTLGLASTFNLCDASAGPFTLTLPPLASVIGAEFIIWKNDVSANVVTIARAGTDLIIPGALTSLSLSAYGKSYRLLACSGSVWVVVGST
jgi:hypothetical protein